MPMRVFAAFPLIIHLKRQKLPPQIKRKIRTENIQVKIFYGSSGKSFATFQTSSQQEFHSTTQIYIKLN
jgi:hypothetical protein